MSIKHATASGSSPLQTLSSDAEDISLAEMSRRMTKRSRQTAVSASVSRLDEPISDGRDDPPQKKLRPSPDSESEVSAAPTGNILDIFPLRAKMMQYCTPQITLRSDSSMLPSSGALNKAKPSPAMSDQLSPLPVTKVMPYRTSSRNLKENDVRLGSRKLASPFHSRPASRSPSPKATAKQKRPPLHRTLSVALNQKHHDLNIDSNQAASLSAAQSVSMSRNIKMAAPGHNRTASIPTISSSLHQISSEAWLVPPKALTRSPTPTQADVDADVVPFQSEGHSSFFLGAPRQVSTPPPRRRRATTGAWNVRPPPDASDSESDWSDVPQARSRWQYDSDVDMSESSCPNSPSDGHKPQARRRRRTIVHLSSDSIFSSALDFSASVTDAGYHSADNLASSVLDGERSRTFLLGPELELGPAFSPAPCSPTLVRVPASALSRSASAPTHAVQNGAGRFPAKASPDVEGDELQDMFSVFGLNENVKKVSNENVDDSGISFSPIAFAPCLSCLLGFHKRVVVNEVARGARTRRTRSGTVTLAAAKAPPHRRRQEGRPTIKMKIHDDRLSVAPGEEDDELLLKPGDTKKMPGNQS
ncbi:hypothetical protein A0H81_05932 [Grifola frondosa]|uniref:Uncharacterized protein n=1 Tax=Grifola frondosa TaxID=5627 RepID=A0A1C7MFU8_GRIFR|nr:hypothetical protein A0H81_05932 [Grifola frondosa]